MCLTIYLNFIKPQTIVTPCASYLLSSIFLRAGAKLLVSENKNKGPGKRQCFPGPLLFAADAFYRVMAIFSSSGKRSLQVSFR